MALACSKSVLSLSLAPHTERKLSHSSVAGTRARLEQINWRKDKSFDNPAKTNIELAVAMKRSFRV